MKYLNLTLIFINILLFVSGLGIFAYIKLSKTPLDKVGRTEKNSIVFQKVITEEKDPKESYIYMINPHVAVTLECGQDDELCRSQMSAVDNNQHIEMYFTQRADERSLNNEVFLSDVDPLLPLCNNVSTWGESWINFNNFCSLGLSTNDEE